MHKMTNSLEQKSKILPLQICELQSICCLISPMQSFPSIFAVELEHVLFLNFSPPPHALEHADHAPQADQAPIAKFVSGHKI